MTYTIIIASAAFVAGIYAGLIIATLREIPRMRKQNNALRDRLVKEHEAALEQWKQQAHTLYNSRKAANN